MSGKSKQRQHNNDDDYVPERQRNNAGKVKKDPTFHIMELVVLYTLSALCPLFVILYMGLGWRPENEFLDDAIFWIIINFGFFQSVIIARKM